MFLKFGWSIDGIYENIGDDLRYGPVEEEVQAVDSKAGHGFGEE